MRVVLYGAGKTAKMLYGYLHEYINICGFVVDNEFLIHTSLYGLPVLSFEELAHKFPKKDYGVMIALGYHSMNKLRKEKYLKVKNIGYETPTFIHPSAVVCHNVKIGDGSIVLDNISIQPDTIIGCNNFISSNSVVGHGSRLGDHSWIAAGTVIAGDVIMDSQCFLGVNCTIVHNVKLARETFVGANCLISSDTEQGMVYISTASEKISVDSKRFMTFMDRG